MKHLFPYEWTLKDAVFTKDQGTVFSCFACGGGSTMGYKLAGFDVIGMNEIDPKMAECYIANHKPKYSYIEPIQEFKLRDDLPEELYNLTILDGSPPCSSFSMAGNREKDWGKDKKFREGQAEQVLDTLFFDFIDVAEKLQPKIVIAENVKGLLLGDAIKYVKEIYKAFDKAGYYVEKWLLDASTMGVPQRRERVFFLAMRKDLVDAIGAAETVDMFNPLPWIDMVFKEKEIPFKNVKSEGHRKPILPAIVDAYEYCIKHKTPDFAQYFENIKGKRKYFNTRLIFEARVCDTIKGDCTHVIEGEAAFINSTEVKKAGSYPIDYDFKMNKTDYLVGMSVPPLMTAQIATRIKEYWLRLF
jgi:DNA (cytosine-5)-methyltransferase 1